jgi:hypothetical protein
MRRCWSIMVIVISSRSIARSRFSRFTAAMWASAFVCQLFLSREGSLRVSIVFFTLRSLASIRWLSLNTRSALRCRRCLRLRERL